MKATRGTLALAVAAALALSVQAFSPAPVAPRVVRRPHQLAPAMLFGGGGKKDAAPAAGGGGGPLGGGNPLEQMKQLQEMRKKTMEVQKKLEEVRSEGVSEDGGCKVFMNGRQYIVEATISDETFAQGADVVSAGLTEATKAALTESQAQADTIVKQMYEDMGLADLMKGMGMGGAPGGGMAPPAV